MPRYYSLTLCIFIVFCLAAPSFAATFQQNLETLVVDAKSAMIMDMSTGNVLFEQNADEKIAPASLTKIMTLYLTYEAIEKGEISLLDEPPVTFKADNTPGSTMHCYEGDKVTVWDLMKGMAVASGNDACVAIAQFFPGGYEAFLQRMNDKARELGMTNTTFMSPNGLPWRAQRTTARDMMILSESYLRRFPEALRIHTMKYGWHKEFKWRNRNKLLGACPGVDGLKTGFVSASGYNIVVTAKRNGKRVLAVLMGAQSPRSRHTLASALVEAGFAAVKNPALAQRKAPALQTSQHMNVRKGALQQPLRRNPAPCRIPKTELVITKQQQEQAI